MLWYLLLFHLFSRDGTMVSAPQMSNHCVKEFHQLQLFLHTFSPPAFSLTYLKIAIYLLLN